MMQLDSSKHTFEFIEKHVRKKTFGVFTNIDSKGRPHSTGVLFGIAPPQSKFALFSVVGTNHQKTKNVRRNPNVSLVVPFPHHFLRFVPDNYVMFRGTAGFTNLDDADFHWAFQQRRILRMSLESEEIDSENAVVIRLTPEPKVFVYGLGLSMMDLRKVHTEGSYSVIIPEHRL